MTYDLADAVLTSMVSNLVVIDMEEYLQIPKMLEKEQILNRLVDTGHYVKVDYQPGIRSGRLCRAIFAGKVLYIPVEEGGGTYPFLLDEVIDIKENLPHQATIIVLKPDEEEEY